MLKGTIDRIEDELAVILIENQDEREQIVVDKKQIPDEMCYSNALISFDMTDGELDNFTHHEDEESDRIDRIQEKFDRLSESYSNDSE